MSKDIRHDRYRFDIESKDAKSINDIIQGFKKFKRYSDTIEPNAFNGETDNVDETKNKLLNIAESKKEENNNEIVTTTKSNEGIFKNSDVTAKNNKSSFDFSAGGFKPDITNLRGYNPNVDIAANLKKGNFYADIEGDASLKGGADYTAEAGYKGDKFDVKINPKDIQANYKGDNVNAGINTKGIHAGAQLNDKVNVDLNKRFDGDTNIAAIYKGDNVNASVDTRGFEIGREFGDSDANISVNLTKDFNGDTDVNVEGIKQLNKYLKAKGFANTSGNYGASLGFDIPL